MILKQNCKKKKIIWKLKIKILISAQCKKTPKIPNTTLSLVYYFIFLCFAEELCLS